MIGEKEEERKRDRLSLKITVSGCGRKYKKKGGTGAVPIPPVYLFSRRALCRRRIAAGYWWENRLQRFRCWLLQLRAIFGATRFRYRRSLTNAPAHHDNSGVNLRLSLE